MSRSKPAFLLQPETHPLKIYLAFRAAWDIQVIFLVGETKNGAISITAERRAFFPAIRNRCQIHSECISGYIIRHRVRILESAGWNVTRCYILLRVLLRDA